MTRLGLEPVARLVIGEPALQIGAFAKEVRADLVVLGQRKMSVLQRWWSGATGAYVSDHVTCSVLIGRNAITDEAFEAFILEQAAASSKDFVRLLIKRLDEHKGAAEQHDDITVTTFRVMS